MGIFDIKYKISIVVSSMDVFVVILPAIYITLSEDALTQG